MGRGQLALLVAIVTTSAGSISTAEHLTLDGAMARAREHAGEAAAAADRAQAADSRAAQARGFRLPSLTLQEVWMRTDSPAEVFALQLNQQRFSFASFMVTDPNRPAFLNTAISRVELSLPVYTGGELSGRISQARLAAQAASDQAKWAGDQAALDAAEAYVMVEQAREYVALLEKARDTVKAHVDLARAYAEQGMIVRSEVLRAEVELSRLDDLVEEAQGRERVAEANLAFRLGADQGTAWELDALPLPTPLAEGLDGWLASAAARKDLVAARLGLRAGELETAVREAAFLPRVGLLGRSDWVDDTPFGSHGKATSIMAVASLNVFSGGSDRAAVAAARWEAKAGAEDVARFEQGVRLQVRQAFQEATTARQRQATAMKALAAAREAERITEERFKTGVVKMLDLLDATTARREAETRELVARADALAAALRLTVLAGRRPESAVQ
jgi:outer membrane protein TolC